MQSPTMTLIGLPTDRNSSFLRGPARAPRAIRTALASDSGNPAAEDGRELGIDMHLEDAGDIPLQESEADDGLIEDAIRRIVLSGRSFVALGGDHSVTYPILRAVAATHGPVDILHFDAHPDLYDAFQGNPRSHASPFARIMEEGLASRLVQVGIRTLERQQRAQARRFGVEIVDMRAFHCTAVPVLTGPLYVSIDLDALDPASAPGVSHPEPGGMTVREMLSVVHSQRARLVGADVVELNPDRDVNGITAIVAAKLVKELCSYAAARC